LPNILDNTSQVNESIESIGKRITILEASTTFDSQNLRIGKLEESMETLSSIFSSLKFKKEKAFVGKEQKIMYVPKVSVPKPHHILKMGKTFSSTKSDLQVESSSGTSKVPSVVSGVIRLKRIYNFLCSMLVLTPFALCFVTLRGVFMHIPELTY
jgi:hypothetical protein